MTRGKVAGGGIPASLPALHVCLRAQVCVCGPGACTRAHCNSAPCDMLGVGGSPVAPGHIWVVLCPSGQGEACEVGCMAHRGAGAPRVPRSLHSLQIRSFEESIEGSGVSKGLGPKCTTLSAFPLDL